MGRTGNEILFSRVVCVVTLVLISLPIITFVILSFVKQYPVDFSFTFDNITESLDLGIGGYLLNSLFIGLTTALAGTLITYYAAFVTARSGKNFSSMAIHLISLVSLSFPGIVLGLSYVLFFQGSFVYGTIAIFDYGKYHSHFLHRRICWLIIRFLSLTVIWRMSRILWESLR